MSGHVTGPTAAWLDSENGLQVYAPDGEWAGIVCVIAPSRVELSPYDALAFGRALIAVAEVADARRRP